MVSTLSPTISEFYCSFSFLSRNSILPLIPYSPIFHCQLKIPVFETESLNHFWPGLYIINKCIAKQTFINSRYPREHSCLNLKQFSLVSSITESNIIMIKFCKVIKQFHYINVRYLYLQSLANRLIESKAILIFNIYLKISV